MPIQIGSNHLERHCMSMAIDYNLIQNKTTIQVRYILVTTIYKNRNHQENKNIKIKQSIVWQHSTYDLNMVDYNKISEW